MDRDLYQQTLNNLISQYGAAADREDTLYGRRWQEQALAREQAAQQQSFYQQQLDAILAAGGSPSADVIAGSGYANEYVQALEAFYKQQALAGGSSGGGNSGGKKDSGGNGNTETTGGNIYQRLYDSGVRTEGDAYAALAAMGYNTTQAGKLAEYFVEAAERLGMRNAGGNPNGYVPVADLNRGTNGSGGVSVDMKSVNDLGYGPIDEAALSRLVDSGQVEQYIEGNKIKFRRTGGASTGGKAW